VCVYVCVCGALPSTFSVLDNDKLDGFKNAVKLLAGLPIILNLRCDEN
jgi:hypothetical protein